MDSQQLWRASKTLNNSYNITPHTGVRRILLKQKKAPQQWILAYWNVSTINWLFSHQDFKEMKSSLKFSQPQTETFQTQNNDLQTKILALTTQINYLTSENIHERNHPRPPMLKYARKLNFHGST